MANAKKKRDRKFPQTEFEISMVDAIDRLMRPQDVEPGDRWHFEVQAGLEGDVLVITRTRTPEELPVDPEVATPARRR